MLNQFVGSAVVIVAFVLDILAHFIEGLLDVQVQVEQLFHDGLVYLVVFGVHLLFRDEVQVIWQVGLVPRVLLDLLQSYSLYGVWLQHSVDQVLHPVRYVVRDEVPTVLDLTEKLGHLVVIKRKGSTNHGVQDDSTGPDINLSATVTQT